MVRSLLAGLGLLVAVPAPAVTFRVPSEFPTINAACDSASLGDTVLVAPGTYTEYDTRPTNGFGTVSAVAFLKDGVVLRSEDGVATTEIWLGPAPTSVGYAFWAEAHTSGETAVEGFTVRTDLPNRGGLGHVVGAKVTIRSCVFEKLANGVGLARADVDVQDSDFLGCQGIAVGGGISANQGQVWVTRCRFVNCKEGAISLSGGSGGAIDYAEIRDSVFEGNTTVVDGAALRINNYEIIVDQCRFVANVSYGFNGGGVMIFGGPAPQVTRCVFWKNQSTQHGGALFLSKDGFVAHNTFYGNTLTGPAFGGGVAIHFANSGVSQRLFNNVIGKTDGALAVTSPGSLVTDCNIYWDNPDGIGVPLAPTDRVIDPLFCDPTNGDFSVAENSPCLPAQSAGCGQIGALGQGCGSVSLESKSWGRIKGSFR